MNGVRETIRFLKNDFKGVFERICSVIVLDITCDNYDRDVSLENLFFNKEIHSNVDLVSRKDFENFLFSILESEEIDFGYIPHEEAAPDEAWEYDEFGLNVFSLCIPVKGFDCHSKEGVITTYKKLSAVKKAVSTIVNNFLI